jgi:uncharacterized membrane protein SpoIIM required for sporulation
MYRLIHQENLKKMKVDRFYHSRRSDWELLSQLLDRFQRGEQRMSPQDIQKLGWLYRAVTADLALAQRDFPRHQVAVYLNQLVARAHSVVYRGAPLARRGVLRFFQEDLPQLYREMLPFIIIALAFLLVPGMIAGFIVYWQPEASEWILPEEVQILRETIEQKELWVDIPVADRPYAASFIMQNNIQVAILAFGVGIFGALPSLWILVLNSLTLGGILGLTTYHGIGFDLGSFVIAHGVIELSVIGIAGGTGLMLGWSVLQPGLLSRRDSLTLAARKAVKLLMGCLPLLVLAGLIEGFISPAEGIPWQVKWGIGIMSGVLLYGYLLMAGRRKAAVRDALFLSIPNID